MTLKDTLCTPALRPRLVQACVQLVDDEVASKGGLSGIAVKGAFKVVKAIKPGFIPEIIDGLFDEFVGSLEPQYRAWSESGKTGGFGAALQTHRRATADALLSVTDNRARRTRLTQIKSLYDKLRPSAEDHVSAAVPGMARILDPHVR